ncbi:MAG: Gfo/Idh/MocA family oxidoreductase [Nitrospirota bacterium]
MPSKTGSASVVRVGVIGCGYWGPNLIRNFSKLQDCQVVAVADREPTKLETVSRLYPRVETMTSGEALLSRKGIDAVVITTPISTHYGLAREALRRGKHVFVEKPMTATVAESEKLVELADRTRHVLMVDHTFIYSGAVRRIKELIDSGEVGETYYYDSVRVNLGQFQHDVNVLWDLGPHDFSIMTHLLDRKVTSVSAVGARLLRAEGWLAESIAYVTIEHSNGILAHFHLNWLSPVKIRRTLIGGSRKMIVYDHLDPDNQVKIFDKGVEIHTDKERYQMLVEYRAGDMWAPKVDQTEALEVACRHFLDCVTNRKRPVTDGQAGLQVVKLLEAAQRSLESQGKTVKF